jgi:hypothetical protein
MVNYAKHYKEVKSKRLQLPETKNNIRFTRDIILEHIAEQSTHVTVNTMKAVSEVAVELQKEQEEELLLTMATLEELKLEFMKKTDDLLRPPEFPIELWKYVFDEQKPLVEERFRSLREHAAYDTLNMMRNRTAESDPIDESKLPKNRLKRLGLQNR